MEFEEDRARKGCRKMTDKGKVTKVVPMLDANDPEFADRFAAVLGIGKDDTVNVMTPQFERLDGRVIEYESGPEDAETFDAIKGLSSARLLDLGLVKFDTVGDVVMWLYPGEWFDAIPDGYEVNAIDQDEPIKWNKAEADSDTRNGMLAYGFRRRESSAWRILEKVYDLSRNEK